MNIYKLHSNPETLAGFDQRTDVPEVLRELARTKQEPAIEQQIMKDPNLVLAYAIKFFNGVGWPAAEEYIMKDAYSAYYYAKYILHRRWKAAEPVIMTDRNLVLNYASKFLKGVGWPAAEPIIIKDPQWAYMYAIDVLEERWPEAEKYIIKDRLVWQSYISAFPDAKR